MFVFFLRASVIIRFATLQYFDVEIDQAVEGEVKCKNRFSRRKEKLFW